MKKNCNIIFAAKDKGGFDALEPIIKKLKKNSKFNLLIVLDNPAYQFAKKKNIKCLSGVNLSIFEIKKIIKRVNPDLIVTGTSRGFSIEKKIINVAKKENIPTISIVDYWTNHTERFGKTLEYLPDYVLAVDQVMKKEMIRCNIPEDRIFITGNPSFDTFSKIKKGKENDNTIVFYSQPFSERQDKHFNEIKIFKDITNVLEKIYPHKEVILKFHPAERTTNKFDTIMNNTELTIKIEKRLESNDLTKKAGLIIGINSMALFNAVLMHKRVMSYQPGIHKKDDFLVSNRYGWSLPVYKRSSLLAALRDIFKKPLFKKEALKKYTHNNSTNKVIRFLKSIVIKH